VDLLIIVLGKGLEKNNHTIQQFNAQINNRLEKLNVFVRLHLLIKPRR